MAKLLREYTALEYDKKQIQEMVQKSEPLVFPAVMQRAEALNANRRRYPRSILEREVLNYQKAVSENRALGEVDHSDTSSVSLKNVGIAIREIGWRGDDVIGKVEVLNTPSGNILKSLMESGIRVGISSRGVGDVMRNESGEDVVDESFVLICFDAVCEPSTAGAWIGESKQVDMQKVIQTLSKRDRVNRIVNDILRR